MDFDAKLDELYIDLPELGSPVAGVAHATKIGKLLYLSGCLPMADGRLIAKGRVGIEVRLDVAKQAARAAAVQALAVIAAESGGTLNHVKQIVHLQGFVATGADFRDHGKVLDGASELFALVFGKAGHHARVAVGAASLPQDACVELALLVELMK